MKKRIFCFILFLVFSEVVADSGFSDSHGQSNIKGKVSPEISNLKVYPSYGTRGTVISITLEIDDPQGFDNISKELFQIREGIEPILLKLFNDGAHGDAQANDNVYSAETTVPKTASAGTHRFIVFVFDEDGNKSNALTYRFTVKELLVVKGMNFPNMNITHKKNSSVTL